MHMHTRAYEAMSWKTHKPSMVGSVARIVTGKNLLGERRLAGSGASNNHYPYKTVNEFSMILMTLLYLPREKIFKLKAHTN